MRVVFAGTAPFAVPSLRRLAEAHDLALVITQPDRPAGRGLRMVSSPVKLAATDLGLDLFQPERLKDAASLARIREVGADLQVVVAYGQILRADLLALPPMGTLNVHGSLLPRHRGAAPVAWAILSGDRISGVTIMQMDAGIDTGPILSQESVPIGPAETARSLEARLADLGATLLLRTLAALQLGSIMPRPQPAGGATYARRLTSEDGKLEQTTMSASELDRRVRALTPSPGCWLTLEGTAIKVLAGRPGDGGASDGLPVDTADGVYILDQVQPAGGRPMAAAAWARGRR